MDRGLENLKQKAKRIKSEIYTLYLASKHPRTPWYCKIMAVILIAYAISPIDFIPDFIPILGYLDDVILLPLGIYLTFKMVPKEVLVECRREAKQKVPASGLTKCVTVILIIIVWLALLISIGYWLLRTFSV